MPTERKVEIVAELTEKLRRSQVTIVADYRGLKVSEMQALRGQLRPLGSEVKVAKNTLTLIAARNVGQEALEGALTGPTALIFVYDNIASNTKAVADYARTSRILTVRGGVLGTKLISPEEVSSLSTLPPKAELQAEALGALAAPVAGVMGLFNSVPQSLVSILSLTQSMVSILDQRARQLESPAS
jgi:large subunit ribosomal protein L10